jgi:hypothetical protein
MGNVKSDIIGNNLKAQAGGDEVLEIYKLMNVNNGGELIRLMKTAMQTKDFTELDYYIKNEVAVKYFYNEGNGQQVLIKRYKNI